MRNLYIINSSPYKFTSEKRGHGQADTTRTHGRRKRQRPADVLEEKVTGHYSGEFQEAGHESVDEPVTVQVCDAQRQTVIHHICHYPDEK